MILDQIGKRILVDPVWSRLVFDQTLKSWRQQEQRVPAELASAERALADTERKIGRLIDRIENGYDDPDVKRRLEERRTDRRELVKKIEQLKRASENRGPEPTEDWVREQLAELRNNLNCNAPAAAYALRDLVNAEIVVSEIQQDGRKRFHLRGRFTIRTSSITDVVAGQRTEGDGNGNVMDDTAEVIVIDFVDPNPLDAEAEKAKPTKR